MDDNSDIITGEQITGKAEHSQRDVSALSTFVAENISYVKTVIAPKLAYDFGQDRDDVEQDLWLKVCRSTPTLPNIENPKSFCFTIGKNNCLNHKRHDQLEIEYLENQKAQDIQSTRKSAGGGTTVLYSSTAASPEEDLLNSELLEKVMEILKSFPPEHKRLFLLFLAGKSPKEIAALTKTPIKTVYGILKRIEKEIYKRFALMNLVISSLGNQTNVGLHP